MAQRKQAGKKQRPAPPAGGQAPIPAAPPPVQSAETPESPEVPFPIVGIGASAGGLAAFEAFFSSMPSDRDPGMAFVLVQHLAPDHKSMLSELVKQYTRMQVFEVVDGMQVQANCAYIIPPNRDMAFTGSRLQLLEPGAPRGQRLPIDFFFRSLAQDQRERAIAIVLSGTGSDGTLGVRAIKGEGGMVMAQNPESTEFDGMPQSAIATGLVDYVLPPAEMPAQLIAYSTRALGGRTTPAKAIPKEDDALKKILALLRAQTKHDFSQYKRNTLLRRIDRRLAIHQIGQMEEYARYLQQQPAEVDALFADLLIGVTRFFRDPEAFGALEKGAIQRLFAGKAEGDLVRVWVPGCSTGEEAYSIAMLLQEHQESLKQRFRLQVFATDIDRRAIEQARAGVYPTNISADISPERLARFFVLEAGGGSYRIQKDIRDLLIFSEQNMIRDPPFSRLDLVSCRNVLIYLDGELQKRLMPLFHYVLKPGGMLFLGTSETVGEFVDLFSPLDQKARLYERRDEAFLAHPPGAGGFVPFRPSRSLAPPSPGKGPESGRLPMRALTEQALLEACAPAGVLVDEHGDILYIHGRTGQYLEPAPGEAEVNVLKMAREGLKPVLATALHQAVAQREPIHHAGLRVKTNGDFTAVDLTVRPVARGAEHPGESPLFLVTLAETPGPGRGAPSPDADPGEDHSRDQTAIELLRQELRAKDEYLQTTTEELETANEELKSANEELQSINEELQSTNEELETSKEELQSINEELTTINTELQQKVSALTQVNNDMNNLIAGTGVGTIFVNHQQHIRLFTPMVTQMINLIQTDVGRPLGHLMSNLAGYDRLTEDVQAVLDTLVPKEVEVQTLSGSWFLMRIGPYRTQENVIEGAVITFFDITAQKEAREALRESAAMSRLAVVVRDTRDAIVMLDFHGRILAWNPGATRLYGWSEAEALTRNIRELIPESLREEELAHLHHLSQAEAMASYQTDRVAKDGRLVGVWVTATALKNDAGEVYAISTIERERDRDRHRQQE